MQLHYSIADAKLYFEKTFRIHQKLMICLLSMTFYSPVICHGQNQNFENGMSYFENAEYLNAIISFSNVVNNKYLLDGDILPKTHNYRAKSIVMQYKQSIESKDTLFLSRFPNILLTAFDDIETARSINDQREEDLLNATEKELLEVTMDFGQMITDILVLDQSVGKEVDSLISLIYDEILMLEKYQPNSYEIKDMLGLLSYKAGAFEKAKSYFIESEEIYESRLGGELDFGHLCNYYYMAWINYKTVSEISQSLTMLKESEKHIFRTMEFVEEEHVKVKMMSLSKKIDHLEFQLKLLNM